MTGLDDNQDIVHNPDIVHNNLVLADQNIVRTTPGTGDPITTAENNRIGDQINVRGINIRMMVELAEQFSDCTFRLMV